MSTCHQLKLDRTSIRSVDFFTEKFQIVTTAIQCIAVCILYCRLHYRFSHQDSPEITLLTGLAVRAQCKDRWDYLGHSGAASNSPLSFNGDSPMKIVQGRRLEKFCKHVSIQWIYKLFSSKSLCRRTLSWKTQLTMHGICRYVDVANSAPTGEWLDMEVLAKKWLHAIVWDSLVLKHNLWWECSNFQIQFFCKVNTE